MNMEKLKEQWKDLKQEPQSNIMSMRCNGMSFTAHKMVGNFHILSFVKGRKTRFSSAIQQLNGKKLVNIFISVNLINIYDESSQIE